MTARVFLDTNILVYAIEVAGPDPEKSALAKELGKRGDAWASTQVLGEFYRTTTSPRRPSPLTHEEAVCWMQFWKRHPVAPITAAHVDLALEIAGRFGIGYYDALVLATARLVRCETVFSEDLNSGQDYGGVTVTNPFI